MNSKQKNSLEYSKPQLEQFEDNTILEVLPQKTDEADSSKYILIKQLLEEEYLTELIKYL